MFSIAIKPVLTQSAADGALPSLFAATASTAAKRGYYGPSRLFELVGPPTAARVAKRAQDAEAGERLSKLSERLVGISFG